jgi:Ni2+-binding GTPase involved in maturation of urease and hydrogenase
MQLITIAGPPSSGKTSILKNVISFIARAGKLSAAVKFDCISTDDGETLSALGIPVAVGLAGNLCPDHFFVCNIQDAIAWTAKLSRDILFVESAGLCNRCSPHIKAGFAACVIDCLSGIRTPVKIGPMLRYADLILITKGDLVSQAEREVFAFQVRRANPTAKIRFVNGMTGQGCDEVSSLCLSIPQIASLSETRLRFTMPAALCSYCLGETRIGKDFQTGNLKKMEFPEWKA